VSARLRRLAAKLLQSPFDLMQQLLLLFKKFLGGRQPAPHRAQRHEGDDWQYERQRAQEDQEEEQHAISTSAATVPRSSLNRAELRIPARNVLELESRSCEC